MASHTTDPRHPFRAATPAAAAVAAALASASADAASVAPRSVPRVRCPGSAASVAAFVRDHVGPRAPALLTGLTSAWPKPPPWTAAEFVDAAGGETEVTVAACPDGRADAVTVAGLFVQPLDVTMRVDELVARLRADDAAPTPPCPILYAQRQCSSLSEFPRLARVIPPDPGPWAAAAFGTPVDAANVWIGGRHSATAWHRDAYENVALTLCGEKTYHLLPPGDGWRLGLAPRPAARWVRTDGAHGAAPCDPSAFAARADEPPTTVRWAGAPPPPPHAVAGVDADPAAFADLYGPFDDGGESLRPPLSVAVPAGCALYLPPLWWHCTTQTGAPCVTVNWWHDMAHDARWAAARLADEVLLGVLQGEESV